MALDPPPDAGASLLGRWGLRNPLTTWLLRRDASVLALLPSEFAAEPAEHSCPYCGQPMVYRPDGWRCYRHPEGGTVCRPLAARRSVFQSEPNFDAIGTVMIYGGRLPMLDLAVDRGRLQVRIIGEGNGYVHRGGTGRGDHDGGVGGAIDGGEYERPQRQALPRPDGSNAELASGPGGMAGGETGTAAAAGGRSGTHPRLSPRQLEVVSTLWSRSQEVWGYGLRPDQLRDLNYREDMPNLAASRATLAALMRRGLIGRSRHFIWLTHLGRAHMAAYSEDEQ